MILARGRYWRVSLTRGGSTVSLSVLRTSLPEDLYGARDLLIEVPTQRWNRVVKNLYSDRKLLGGLLLDFARHKDRVGVAVGSERLLAELQRVVLEATVALLEQEVLVLAPHEGD